MKNLVSILHDSLPSGGWGLDDGLRPSERPAGIALNGTSIFFAASNEGVVSKVDMCLGKVISCIDLKSFDDVSGNPPLLPEDGVIMAMEYLSDSDILCLAASTGEIITIPASSNGHTNGPLGAGECVGALDAGINAMAWSPDQEVVVFATRAADSVVLMSKDWEMIAESPVSVLPDEEQSSSSSSSSDKEEFIPSITWRGDGRYFAISAKSSLDGSNFFRVFERTCIPHSKSEAPGMGPIGKAPGAAARAASAAATASRLCSSVLSWRPSGSMIVSPEYSTAKNVSCIGIYERNGLRHYELPFTFGEGADANKGRVDVTQLLWSPDSDVLAIVLKYPTSTTHVVQLWSRSNYHWYMKRELRFPDPEEPMMIKWDSEQALTLYILTSSGALHRHSFVWDTIVSPSHNSCACVVDGFSALLTPLRHAIVPPPMASQQAVTERHVPISAVAFSANGHLALLSSNGILSVFDKPVNEKPPFFGLAPSPLLTYPLSSLFSAEQEQRNLYSLRHLQLLHSAQSETMLTMLAVASSASMDPSQNETVLEFAIHLDSKQVSLLSSTSLSFRVLRTFADISPLAFSTMPTVFLQSTQGQLFPFMPSTLSSAASLSPSSSLLSLPTPCPHFAIARFSSGSELCPVGLSDRGVLFLGGASASPHCSSFSLTSSQFLLYTTHANQLRILPLYLSSSDALSLAQSPPSGPYDESARELERGSALVSSAFQLDHSHSQHDNGTRIVLQISPRGNLEAIHPRALLLNHLCRLLNQGQYGQALVIARRHKVDMNLLYDHSPQTFLKQATLDSFVSQILSSSDEKQSAEYFSVFLSQLRDEDTCDVSTGIFPGYRRMQDALQKEEKESESPPKICAEESHDGDDDGESSAPAVVVIEAPKTKGKVNAVCLALRAAFSRASISASSLALLLPNLVTYARCEPPQLEAALELIRSLRKNNQKDLMEKSLEHLIFLANVDHLFNVALGMYDFALVLMVAQKSQKDPKEYIPFLQKLQRMPMKEQHFAIDSHLGRNEKALNHLFSMLSSPGVAQDEVKSTEIKDRIMEWTNKHSLHVAALALCKSILLPALVPVPSVNAAPSSLPPAAPTVGSFLSKLRTSVPVAIAAPSSSSSVASRAHSPLTPIVSALRSTLLEAYASNLQILSKFEQAGHLFLESGQLSRAAECFASAGNWQLSLTLYRRSLSPSSSSAASPEEAQMLYRVYAQKTASDLRRSGRHLEAATIFRTHLNDDEEAVSTLCSGHYFEDAIAMSTSCGRDDLLETTVRPSVLETAEAMINECNDKSSKYREYVDRLQEIRKDRAEKEAAIAANPDAFGEGGDWDHMDSASQAFSDAPSFASSAASGMSGRSNRSSGSSRSDRSALSRASGTSNVTSASGLRRRSKKKLRIRKGSPQEEHNIAEALRKFLPSNDYLQEIARILRGCCFFGLVEKCANPLQRALDAFLDQIRSTAEVADFPIVMTASHPLLHGGHRPGVSTFGGLQQPAEDDELAGFDGADGAFAQAETIVMPSVITLIGTVPWRLEHLDIM